MFRLSFSQTLLASFLLIAAILGTAALGGLNALEDFAARSRAAARDALDASTAAQQLSERTVDMERSARQFLVLGDRLLLERFLDARTHAETALDRLAPKGSAEARALIDTWQTSSSELANTLSLSTDMAQATESLGHLALLNERIASEIRKRLERDNQKLLDELEASRVALEQRLTAAILAACLLAALTAWWIVRPLNRVEHAINALGESRFDRPIEIGGPDDLQNVGQRLDWLRLRLADLEANRTRVLQHVSHELKTPLASLREGIALLDDGVVGTLTGEQREVVDILQHNTRTLQARIEGLLGYNAAIFDARELKRRHFKPRALVEAVIAEQQLTIQARELHVIVEGAPPAVHADSDKLHIAITNLITNAISFSPPHGEIRIVLNCEASMLQIDCIDQGPGARPEEAERIFEPFFQGSRPPPLPRNGSGLGLSIVRAFVAAHGGRVSLLPDGPGAHFRMELPYGA